MLREDAKREFSYANNTEARMGNPHDQYCTGTLNEFKNKGLGDCKVIASKPYSNHPDDYYLRMVLSELPNQYAVHFQNLYDSVRCGEPIFHQGNYFPKTYEGLGQAMQRFNERDTIHFVEPNPDTIKNFKDETIIEELQRRLNRHGMVDDNDSLATAMKAILVDYGAVEAN